MSNKKITKSKGDINAKNTIPNIRIILVSLLILGCMITLLCRVGYLQLIDGKHLQTLATSQQTLTETISAKRGNIYDSTGQTLAFSYDTDKVYISPSIIKDENKKTIANGLAEILGLNSTTLLEKLNNSTSQFLVAENLEKEKIDKLREWKNNLDFTTGISIETSPSRSYPYGSLASTVIGFVGADNQGSVGIEYSWNSFLSGTSGKSVALKDASQSEIANSNETYIAAENGYDLTLTIDVNIQNIVENCLAEAVTEYKCESGITIAMDPSTGKILALADYPSFDCNDKDTPNEQLAEIWDTLSSEKKFEALYKMWTPKSVTDTYDPGSVFKIITSAIALEEDLIEADTKNVYKCTGKYYIEGESKPIKCLKSAGHGYESLTVALANSCNPFFINLGLKIGASTSYKYYEAFGFFSKTGISLSGEPSSGVFYDLNTINQHELGTMSFGQGFGITPLQMITAAAAIANDGVLVQPQIVESIANTDTGEITTFQRKQIRQVISKETADTVASMMEEVVVSGTGHKVKTAVDGMMQYSVGGKTGTSEPLSGNDDDGYIASYLAISPVENTKIVLLVVLYSPGEGVNHNGGQIAAPTAGKMLRQILPYMGIETGSENTANTNNLSENELY